MDEITNSIGRAKSRSVRLMGTNTGRWGNESWAAQKIRQMMVANKLFMSPCWWKT